MFAALVLVSLTGIGLHLAMQALARRVLGRWHDSER
jgi:NitT/TauT family transport system permease protein